MSKLLTGSALQHFIGLIGCLGSRCPPVGPEFELQSFMPSSPAAEPRCLPSNLRRHCGPSLLQLNFVVNCHFLATAVVGDRFARPGGPQLPRAHYLGVAIRAMLGVWPRYGPRWADCTMRGFEITEPVTETPAMKLREALALQDLGLALQRQRLVREFGPEVGTTRFVAWLCGLGELGYGVKGFRALSVEAFLAGSREPLP